MYYKKKLSALVIILLCFFSTEIVAQKSITAKKINPHPPRIDGLLNEKVWEGAEFATGFTQQDPNEGEPASQETKVAFFYDDNALYIGAIMKSESDVNAAVSRRDEEGNAEYLIVSLDTYNDDRTAYSFGITAAGTRLDHYHPRDSYGAQDDNYDPVWEGSSRVTPDGWSAEFRIPFSQLRFNENEAQVWGVNLNRRIPAKNEDAYWVMVPKDETGWASRFGQLRGIEGVETSSRIEVIPYISANSTVSGRVNPDNPFSQKTSFTPRLGGDIKAGLGSDFTVEATINPDFGQVEADPARVNLSAFETFFSEKRPFFIEGRQLLQGGGKRYFHSRRIGARPSGPADGDFTDRPDNTTILGATKLTGRTFKGLSVGVLASVTGREYARTFDADSEQFGRTEVEPLTGFGVVRIQQELDDHGSTFGGILTGVKRDVNGGSVLAPFFNRQAFTGALDWEIRLKEGEYALEGDVGFSTVSGSSEAILDLQTSSGRYYQRPDAVFVTLDSSRTNMRGFTGSLEFRRRSADHWLYRVRAFTESPGFEINDIGRNTNVNDLGFFGGVTYQENTPGEFLRDYSITVEGSTLYNYSGIRTRTWSNVATRATFKNFWTGFVHFFVNYPSLKDNLTRGGVLMREPFGWSLGSNFSTNQSKDFAARFSFNTGWDEFGGNRISVSSRLRYRPADKWSVSLRPRISKSTSSRQYVGTFPGGGEETFGNRYTFSFLDRTTVSSQIRVDYIFNPDLSLEVYAEPFVSSGHFYRFGELEAARSGDLREYGKADDTSIRKDENGNFVVNDRGDTFSFSDHDFKFLSFRSNVVLRWQWRPGSEFFLVWGQDRSQNNRQHTFRGRDLLNTLSTTGDQFFAMKVRYWFSAN